MEYLKGKEYSQQKTLCVLYAVELEKQLSPLVPNQFQHKPPRKDIELQDMVFAMLG